MHGERKTITILWKIVIYDSIDMKKENKPQSVIKKKQME